MPITQARTLCVIRKCPVQGVAGKNPGMLLVFLPLFKILKESVGHTQTELNKVWHSFVSHPVPSLGGPANGFLPPFQGARKWGTIFHPTPPPKNGAFYATKLHKTFSHLNRRSLSSSRKKMLCAPIMTFSTNCTVDGKQKNALVSCMCSCIHSVLYVLIHQPDGTFKLMSKKIQL